MTRRWTVRILWEPRDLWVGLYWDRLPTELRLYFCIAPMLPILVTRKADHDAH